MAKRRHRAPVVLTRAPERAIEKNAAMGRAFKGIVGMPARRDTARRAAERMQR